MPKELDILLIRKISKEKRYKDLDEGYSVYEIMTKDELPEDAIELKITYEDDY